MNVAQKKEFRKSSKWRQFRLKMKRRFYGKDAITGDRLTRTWNLHHLNLDSSKYDDLTNESCFIPLNENTHKIVHWIFKHIQDDKLFWARLVKYIQFMCKINGAKMSTNPSYKNNKTGHVYTVLNDNVINTTNSSDGIIMILYTDGIHTFIREADEFFNKFTALD